jgi:hypothetical protein
VRGRGCAKRSKNRAKAAPALGFLVATGRFAGAAEMPRSPGASWLPSSHLLVADNAEGDPIAIGGASVVPCSAPAHNEKGRRSRAGPSGAAERRVSEG